MSWRPGPEPQAPLRSNIAIKPPQPTFSTLELDLSDAHISASIQSGVVVVRDGTRTISMLYADFSAFCDGLTAIRRRWEDEHGRA